MNASHKLALQEGFVNVAARQKRLGQYFTGPPLARLLAALADADTAHMILDPMAGSGDMLIACREYGATGARFGAVEIDPIARGLCAERAPWTFPILGNAFDLRTLSGLATLQWDLIITNPPYVRYQRLSTSAGSGFRLPSGIEVRKGLLAIIENAPSLDKEDRLFFSSLAIAYSGLADMAVPSWILSAALCSSGGKIALVLPESWLSRDYAAVIQYLLLRWFRVRYIVEDAHAAWFPQAQVKTTLLVAERIRRRESAFDWKNDETFLRLRVSGKAAGASGVVDRIFPAAEKNAERRFASLAADLSFSGKSYKSELLEVDHVPLALVAKNLQRSCSKHKWLPKLEINSSTRVEGSVVCETYHIPAALASLLSSFAAVPRFTTMETLGVKIGQGLRTGMNNFFYVDAIGNSQSGTIIETSATFGQMQATVPTELILPVLRRQSELPDGYVLKASQLKGRVLLFHNYAIVEDIENSEKLATTYNVMPDEISRFVRVADAIEFNGKRIRDLSAVAPNIRRGVLGKNILPRYWYMLPNLTQRHLPDLFVARVNTGRPRVLLNNHREAVVDANFSTIWTTEQSVCDAWALLALLNSSWCVASLELSAAVMGGGALKVEAAHLRRIPIPALSSKEWKLLSKFGHQLACGVSLTAMNSVDKIISSSLFGMLSFKMGAKALSELSSEAAMRRKNQKRIKYKKLGES